MKLMVLIWKARRPEQFSQGNWRREMGVLHSYFYIALLVGVIVIYQLSDFVEYIVFAFYSFWVWQIAHNVQHDTPRPLLPKYIIGTSAARLLLPLYVFGCPKNFIRSDPVRGSSEGKFQLLTALGKRHLKAIPSLGRAP